MSDSWVGDDAGYGCPWGRSETGRATRGRMPEPLRQCCLGVHWPAPNSESLIDAYW